MIAIKPLNGDKTHPLTAHGYEALARINQPKGCPTMDFNPGVVNRLLREELAEIFTAPSPYRSSKGRTVQFLRITDAGRQTLRGRP